MFAARRCALVCTSARICANILIFSDFFNRIFQLCAVARNPDAPPFRERAKRNAERFHSEDGIAAVQTCNVTLSSVLSESFHRRDRGISRNEQEARVSHRSIFLVLNVWQYRGDVHVDLFDR